MTDDIQFTLTGLDSLLGKLDAIKQETKRKTGRAALRKAANVVRDAAKANAERIDDAATGRSIAENVAVQWNGKRFKRTGDLAFRVGVRHGSKVEKKGNPDEGASGPTPHWRFKEFGTEKMAAEPFMRPALENNINPATDTFIREYEKGIDRAIKRALKKGTTA